MSTRRCIMGYQRPTLPKCPQCDRIIRSEDIFCRHCGFRLESAAKGSRGARRTAYIAAVIGTAAVSGIVILHAVTTPLATGPQLVKHAQSVAVSQPTATSGVGATNSSPSPSPSIASGSWSLRTVSAHAVGFSLQLPTNWVESSRSSQDHWIWTAPSGPGKVSLVVRSYQNPGATENLGPSAYGTPITTSAHGVSSQQLDVKWAPHHWLWVTMKVPKSQVADLATIARSVNIT